MLKQVWRRMVEAGKAARGDRKGSSHSSPLVSVYCAEIWREATVKAAEDAFGKGKGNITEIVSPPMTASDPSHIPLIIQALSGKDLIWLNLHGFEETPLSLYGQNREGEVFDAINGDILSELDLGGAIVFTESCYGADGGSGDDNTSLSEFLVARGAMAVVGGKGENFGGRTRPIGADRLGMWFCRQLMSGSSVDVALRRAKLFLAWDISRAGLDAKKFRVTGNGEAKLRKSVRREDHGQEG